MKKNNITPTLSIQGNYGFEILIDNLIKEELTMVFKHKFETVLRNFENINSLEGEIVECGTWKGGFSIFMSHLFYDKKIWVCDSFEGFQPLEEATYNSPVGERHDESLFKERMNLSLDEVKETFKKYGLEDKRISFLKGYVKDTLKPDTCEIGNIALLRIDVDSYSATREVLDLLYDKVVKGGYIVFDDSELFEANQAMNDFFKERNINVEYLHPVTDKVCENLPDADPNGGWHTNYPEGYMYYGGPNPGIVPTGLYIIKK